MLATPYRLVLLAACLQAVGGCCRHACHLSRATGAAAQVATNPTLERIDAEAANPGPDVWAYRVSWTASDWFQGAERAGLGAAASTEKVAGVEILAPTGRPTDFRCYLWIQADDTYVLRTNGYLQSMPRVTIRDGALVSAKEFPVVGFFIREPQTLTGRVMRSGSDLRLVGARGDGGDLELRSDGAGHVVWYENELGKVLLETYGWR